MRADFTYFYLDFGNFLVYGFDQVVPELHMSAFHWGLAPDYGCDAPTFDTVHEAQNNEQGKNPYAPFCNASTYCIT